MGKKITMITTMVMLILILIFSVGLNIHNYNEEKERQENADVNFNCFIEFIPRFIDDISKTEEKGICDAAILGSVVTKAKIYYEETSYYKDNPELEEALFKLENGIANNKSIDKVLEENRLKPLIPVLEEIYKNPRNSDLNQELIDLVDENCYIGN